MSDPTAVALKFGFLAVLYLFLLWVARSSLRDLRRRGEPAVAAGVVDDEREGGLDPLADVDPRLEVVAAMGRRPGEALSLDGGAMMGRAASADVRIEDAYASSAHARIFRRGDAMYIEDMGSTNGTYLNGRALERPEPLNPGDTIRIGETEYRYRE